MKIDTRDFAYFELRKILEKPQIEIIRKRFELVEFNNPNAYKLDDIHYGRFCRFMQKIWLPKKELILAYGELYYDKLVELNFGGFEKIDENEFFTNLILNDIHLFQNKYILHNYDIETSEFDLDLVDIESENEMPYLPSYYLNNGKLTDMPYIRILEYFCEFAALNHCILGDFHFSFCHELFSQFFPTIGTIEKVCYLLNVLYDTHAEIKDSKIVIYIKK